jgi:DNA processing protein
VVKPIDLKLSEQQILASTSNLRLSDSIENPTSYFASVAWSVLCEPGDAFAGQLVRTFGAARALELELERTTAARYVGLFADCGSDWVEVQKFGRFERTLSDARERWHPRMNLAHVVGACERMAEIGGWFLTPESQHWPSAFIDLEHHAPRGLWGLGSIESLRGLDRAISFVGSRMSSSYGESACHDLISPLVERDYSIVSGGAYGIDAAVHRATLAVGGVTLAMMAGGLDRLYPSGNNELFRELSSSGALLSELPPGAEPTKWRFLQRNRLIAALGQATIVVEANPRSGAVSTANRALELGRPLGAVPGPINAPGSDGCHQLIRSGQAELITCVEDILEMVRGTETADLDRSSGLGALETRVHDVIGFGGADLGVICRDAGLTNSEALIGIASLTLLGLIEEDSTGWRRRS